MLRSPQGEPLPRLKWRAERKYSQLPSGENAGEAGAVAVGGHEAHRCFDCEVVHADLVALLAAADADEGQVAAVGRPHHLVVAVDADLAASSMMTLVFVARSSSQVRPVLVGVRQPFAVRRRVQVPAVAGAVVGEALAVAGAVGGIAPDFVFAGGVDDRVDPFVVVAEYGAAGARAFGHGDLDAALGAGAGDRHAAARGKDDALAPCWPRQCWSVRRAAN